MITVAVYISIFKEHSLIGRRELKIIFVISIKFMPTTFSILNNLITI